MALGAAIAALGCGAEGGWALASRVRLVRLNDGLQRRVRLGAGFLCEAAALNVSHARAERAWRSAQQ
eukprot:2734397-Prymnesium_polylepis.2